MSRFGKVYASYYDLLYRDKSYENEAKYVRKLLKKYAKGAKSILDLGCGTARHDELLCKYYDICGVDISLDMLEMAKKRAKEGNLSFIHSDILTLDLQKTYDGAISLFHVLSYQNTNKEAYKMFEVAKKHLKKGGIFIFDFWYGPAVLTDPPCVRVKKLENENIQVTRVANPMTHPMKNIVDVEYDIFIKNKKTKSINEFEETHKMRYFFDNELELMCKKTGFKVLKKYKWLSREKPSLQSWNVVWVVKKEY